VSADPLLGRVTRALPNRSVVVRAIAALGLATLLACNPSERRVLILDLALSDPALVEGTAAPWASAGYVVEYRPRYPHLTRNDLTRYGVVVLLGGPTPERWSDALSGGDLALLTEWVPHGGVVVLGYAGDGEGGFDRWVMNRWLGGMGTGIAISADVLQDTSGATALAHSTHPTARAAPGTLDQAGRSPFPAGRNHALSVRASDQAIAHAPASAFIQREGTAPLSRANAPVVAASRVAQGLVVVASRHLLGAVGSELRAVDASPLVRDSLAATRRFLVALARWTRRPAEWAGIPPSTGGGHVTLLAPPRDVAIRPPRLAPPATAATWRLPRPDEQHDSGVFELPGWIERDGLRIGWSDAPLTTPAGIDSLIGFLDAAGLNALASPPGRALLADTAPPPRTVSGAPLPPWREALTRLGATSIRWFPVLRVGGADQPCVLDDSLWGGTIAPAVRVLAERARVRGTPIAGVAFAVVSSAGDSQPPELCDANLRASLHRMGRDTAWIEHVVALPLASRYDALLDAGMLDGYFAALEAELAARAASVAAAARRRAPALLFALWTADPPADWRAFGLARGLGVDGAPTLLWDAEPLPGAILAAYRRRSVQPVHVLRLRPELVQPRGWTNLRAAVFDSNAGFWVGPVEALMTAPYAGGGPVPGDSLERLIRRVTQLP
jgi:hypothetical protein